MVVVSTHDLTHSGNFGGVIGGVGLGEGMGVVRERRHSRTCCVVWWMFVRGKSARCLADDGEGGKTSGGVSWNHAQSLNLPCCMLLESGDDDFLP